MSADPQSLEFAPNISFKLNLEIIEIDLREEVRLEDLACLVYSEQKLVDVCVFMGLEQIVTIPITNLNETVKLVLENNQTKHILGTVSIFHATFFQIEPLLVYEHWVSLYDKGSFDLYRGSLRED